MNTKILNKIRSRFTIKDDENTIVVFDNTLKIVTYYKTMQEAIPYMLLDTIGIMKYIEWKDRSSKRSQRALYYKEKSRLWKSQQS